MTVDDLNDPLRDLKNLASAQRRASVATPLRNSAIGAEGLLVYAGGRIWFVGGGGLDIQDGGFINIDGDLTGAGALTWTGPWKLAGPGDIEGAADITGILTLLSQLLVKSGGKITVQGAGGDVVLDSSFADPRILLGAANINGGATSITLSVPGTTVYFFESTIRIPAMPTKTSASTGLPVGVVHADATGKFFRIV